MAQGSPGDAGGGGTDADPGANDMNTGGGGGSNGGAGGNGGYPWTSQEPKYPLNNPGQHSAAGWAAAGANNNPDIGGRGAQALSPSAARVFMGGGGGAGSNNNGSNNNSYNNYGSSGGTGGGIVMLRIANTSGAAATIYANGTVGLAPDNDGGGGGGAGGSVVISSPQSFTGITVQALGAAGTSAYNKSGDTTLTTAHGPGGGGGGGAVFSTSPVSANISGGSNGVTVYGQNIAYGATSGSAGTSALVNASSIPGVPSGAECYSSTSPQMYAGPVDTTDGTYTGAAETGSFDGRVSASNNNDFTARSFDPGGVAITNSGTVPGTPVGATLSGTATASSGWTVRLCPGTTSAADCSGATTTPFAPSTAGATSSVTYTVAGHTAQTNTVWAVYSAPTGTVGFTRYDGVLTATDGTYSNTTHNELYAGFIPITKQTTIVSTGCPASVTPPASGVCPNGVVQYTLDYRNIMAGGGIGTEGQLQAAFLSTAAGQLSITDNGAAGGSNWATYSNGLKEILNAGVTNNTLCGTATTGKCGDSTAGTTYTGNTVGSTSFTATIGGATFQLVPSGVTGTSQGTITFAVTIK